MTLSRHLIRASILTLSLSLHSVPLAYAAGTNAAAETIENTTDDVQDRVRGFDDWGLLGLIGLLGLLGLRGRNRNVVVDGTRR